MTAGFKRIDRTKLVCFRHKSISFMPSMNSFVFWCHLFYFRLIAGNNQTRLMSFRCSCPGSSQWPHTLNSLWLWMLVGGLLHASHSIFYLGSPEISEVFTCRFWNRPKPLNMHRVIDESIPNFHVMRGKSLQDFPMNVFVFNFLFVARRPVELCGCLKGCCSRSGPGNYCIQCLTV